MMRLGNRSRAAVAAVAFVAFAGAFIRAADDARGAAASPEPPPHVTRAPGRPRADAPVALRRDPFAEPVADPTPAPRDPLPPIPATLPVLPPNAGALPPGMRSSPLPSIDAARSAALRVAAVVTGPRPVALVVDGAETRLLANGDRVGTTTVSSIGPDGVRLRDGTFLTLVPAGARPAHGGLRQ
ncbi:MAG TPA: hypothetical protein VHT53_01400 [Candidatus Elarobacter sp.]|nr:hypothetical protein [Candidatus Elarobacter sp.]